MSLTTWFARRFQKPSLGQQGERAAARYLSRQRYAILAAQSRTRYGEFDLIAVDCKTVVFVEVKTRRKDVGIRPADAVDELRRRRMTRAATAYLKAHGLLGCPARFDIVEVVWPEGARRPDVRHHANAFAAEGRGQFYR